MVTSILATCSPRVGPRTSRSTQSPWSATRPMTRGPWLPSSTGPSDYPTRRAWFAAYSPNCGAARRASGTDRGLGDPQRRRGRPPGGVGGRRCSWGEVDSIGDNHGADAELMVPRASLLVVDQPVRRRFRARSRGTTVPGDRDGQGCLRPSDRGLPDNAPRAISEQNRRCRGWQLVVPGGVRKGVRNG